MDKRIIELQIPVKEISTAAVHEKNIRHGHISTLHAWWARRPLASSRSLLIAALISEKILQQKNIDLKTFQQLLASASRWENCFNEDLLRRLRTMIIQSNEGHVPRVLDPFAGGGSIPLEALRMGCETHAIDYNPVAVFLQKCMLEFPQRHGQALKEAVNQWASWCIKETRQKIGKYHEIDPQVTVLGYLWTWELTCPNPGCNLRIPLLKHYWLSRKKRKQVFLYPLIDRQSSSADKSSVEFILGVRNSNGDLYLTRDTRTLNESTLMELKERVKAFDPSRATVYRANVQCPRCQGTISSKKTREMFKARTARRRMLIVIYRMTNKKGKFYRLVTERDLDLHSRACQDFTRKMDNHERMQGLSLVPHEELPPEGTLGFGAPSYGMKKWSDLYDQRQLLFLTTLLECIVSVKSQLLSDPSMDPEFVKAVISYLALWFDMVAAFHNRLTRWENRTEAVKNVFSRHALPMLWDNVEANPFNDSSGGITTTLRYQLKVLDHCLKVSSRPARVQQGSAVKISCPSDYFDVIYTDPPYYDNVPYAPLSDFFYVWLKRIVGDFFPELFKTPLTPKSGELVAYTRRQDRKEAMASFERNMTKAFSEMYRVLKPNGILLVVFAHKSLEAWTATISALLSAGFVITAAWPIATEMKGRLRSLKSSVLSSSIHLVARKRARKSLVLLSELRAQLKKQVETHVLTMMDADIQRPDIFITVLGKALETWSSWKTIMDSEGRIVSLNEFLEEIPLLTTAIISRRLGMMLNESSLSSKARFYLTWRWLFGDDPVPHDLALKIGLGMGLDVTKELQEGDLLKKDQDKIKLSNAWERKLTHLERSPDFLDQFHRLVILKTAPNLANIKEFNKKEPERDPRCPDEKEKEQFTRFATMLIDILPRNSREATLLRRFLARMKTS